jgi:hypothetical protein
MEVRGFAILHCSQLTGTLTLPSPLFKAEAERSRLLRVAKLTDPLGHDVATAVSADADASCFFVHRGTHRLLMSANCPDFGTAGRGGDRGNLC